MPSEMEAKDQRAVPLRTGNEIRPEEDMLPNRFGLWSSLVSAIFVAATTTAAVVGLVGYLDTTVIQYSLWLALAPAIALMMLSINYSSISYGRRILSGASVAFVLIYVVIISMNYYVQLSAVRLESVNGPIVGIELFSLSTANLHTVAWSLEVLGYGFQALGMLFVAPLFSGDRIRHAIRWLLIINGLNGILGLVIFPLDLNPLVFVSSFFIWSILFPIMSAMIAVQFRRMIS